MSGPDGVNPAGIDDAVRADLVAFALGQLPGGEADALRERVLADPALCAELDSIRRHLDFHADAPEIQPSPVQFDRIRAAIRADRQAPAAPKPRSFWSRYWMSLAAAALLIAALILPRGREPDADPVVIEAVAGDVTRTADGSWTSTSVSRIRFGTGVVVTLDTDTVVKPVSAQRLFLGKGRIFVEAAPQRRGLTIMTTPFEVETTGTSFLVESDAGRGRVAVESGAVRVRYSGDARIAVATGQELRSPATRPTPIPRDRPIRWFEIPSLSAKILNPTTVAVVLHNEMIDEITLAPPTNGKPLFFATVGSHNYPHEYPQEPANFGQNVKIPPGGTFEFPMTLPTPLAEDDRVLVRCPSLGLEVEARR
jgi:hypothetical protein